MATTKVKPKTKPKTKKVKKGGSYSKVKQLNPAAEAVEKP